MRRDFEVTERRNGGGQREEWETADEFVLCWLPA